MDQDEKQKDKRIIFFELENGAVKKIFANHSGIGVLLIGVAFLLMRKCKAAAAATAEEEAAAAAAAAKAEEEAAAAAAKAEEEAVAAAKAEEVVDKYTVQETRARHRANFLRNMPKLKQD